MATDKRDRVKNKKTAVIQRNRLGAGITYVSFACIIMLALSTLFAEILRYFPSGNNAADLMKTGASSLVAVGLPALVCSYFRGGVRKNLKRYIRRCKRIDSFMICAAGFFVCVLLNFFSGIVSRALTGEYGTKINAHGFWEIAVAAVSLSVLPALCEEFAFRGIVMGILSRGGECFAIISSALFFALLHQNIGAVLFAFGAGLVLGEVRRISGRLLPCIIVHFLNNIFALALNLAEETMKQSDFTSFLTGFLIFCGVSATILFAVPIIRGAPVFEFDKRKCVLTKKQKMSILFLSPIFLIFAALSVLGIIF